MPIYEYYCSKCKAETEKFFTSIQGSSVVFCEICGKQLKKIISAANFKCDRADGKEAKNG